MRESGEYVTGYAYGVKKKEVKVAVKCQKHIFKHACVQCDPFKSVFDKINRTYLAADFPEKRQFGAYLDIQKSTSGSLFVPSMFIEGSSLPCIRTLKKTPCCECSGRALGRTRAGAVAKH